MPKLKNTVETQHQKIERIINNITILIEYIRKQSEYTTGSYAIALNTLIYLQNTLGVQLRALQSDAKIVSEAISEFYAREPEYATIIEIVEALNQNPSEEELNKAIEGINEQIIKRGKKTSTKNTMQEYGATSIR